MTRIYILLLALVLTSFQIKAELSSVEGDIDYGDDFINQNENVSDDSNEIPIEDNLELFYDSEDFSMSLSDEIEFRARMVLAELDSDLTSDVLKDIFPDKCDILIDQIANIVRSKVTAILLEGSRDIKKACPKWDTLSEIEKKNFYVALVTSMALEESSCNNRKNNSHATNGTAYGLWQSTKPLTVKKGANWAISQIGNQVEKSGLLFWGSFKYNYWAVLNPNKQAYKVQRLLMKIPACAVQAIKKSAQEKNKKRKK